MFIYCYKCRVLALDCYCDQPSFAGVTAILTAAALWVLSMLFFAGDALAEDMLKIPADSVPIGASGCRDAESQETGVCIMFISPSSGMWMIMTQNGDAVMLRNRGVDDETYTTFWRAPSFAVY